MAVPDPECVSAIAKAVWSNVPAGEPIVDIVAAFWTAPTTEARLATFVADIVATVRESVPQPQPPTEIRKFTITMGTSKVEITCHGMAPPPLGNVTVRRLAD